jgi:Gnt-I system low-affinity gluconate transporter
MDVQLIFAVFVGIALLLFLILRLKIQAFLALLISSMAVGLLAGMPTLEIIESMKKGMGGTLGFVATVVGLGAIFGAILEHSGGTKAIAVYLLKKFGEDKAPWAMTLTGFIVAIPVFFDVAFIILVPIIYSLQKRTGKSLLLYAIPLLAGLAATHAFIPPTPGPIAVADIIGADLGWVILFGAICGLPAVIIAGPFFGKYISNKIIIEAPEGHEEPDIDPNQLPSIGLILTIIGFPIFLIVLNTVSQSLGENLNLSSEFLNILGFIGHPFTALILANLIAWYLLGIRKGYSKTELYEISTKSLAPAGIIILLTGAGGVFKQILVDTEAGKMMAEALSGSLSSPFIFAFIVAGIVRIIQGSATVAMITAAGMTASLIASIEMGDHQKALLVIAIASGATIVSHVNDSGFWLVNRYLGLTEKQTFQSWTMMTTILGLSGFVMVLILSIFV